MPYLTIEQIVRKNGDRHLERAIAYASAGYPERYYQGSMNKALRNFKLADRFKTSEWEDKLFAALASGIAFYYNDGEKITLLSNSDVYLK